MDTAATSPEAQRLLAMAPAALPVLHATREGLAHWAARPDHADANRLADVVLRDPFMVMRTLHLVASRFGSRLATPVQTVTAALVLVGVDPFFRACENLPVLQDRLAHEPAALQGALAAIERAHAAARIAAAFAVHRQDDDAELLHQAALLHDFAGLLLWCEASGAALAIAMAQKMDPALRSVQAQRAVLGIELSAIGQQLLERWGVALPVRQAVDALHGDSSRTRTLRLAVQVARHLEHGGWHNPALPDDFTEAGHLLNLPADAAASLVRQAL
ncbi:HDOD domain-containing protein [Ramlibacter humi]|uniref:HDOD domain-containing protein n=1 Tax=Ramlibacter humi TaxID=2530451 RepID=A0A4Z0CBJ6_9BURK|nr:HDOD domain-containing protein [Ramlibacter humi]TFZ08384.1 HDOD domain-containing protein [Ramlibacter humi]